MGSSPFWAQPLANGWSLKTKTFVQGIQLIFLGVLIFHYMRLGSMVEIYCCPLSKRFFAHKVTLEEDVSNSKLLL